LIEQGLHLGYRKPCGRRGAPAAAGKWVVRHYAGKQTYVVETIGVADDFSDADGVAVLDFKQAQDLARGKMVQRAHTDAGVVAGPLTVAGAIAKYFASIEDDGRRLGNAKYHADAFIVAALGDVEVSALTAEKIRKWHQRLAKTPARVRTKFGAATQAHRALEVDNEDAARRRKCTANRILTTLRAALNFCFREKLVTSDAEWRRVKPFKNVDASRVRYLKVAEAQRLINACNPDFRAVVQAALQTGARYGELGRLKVDDFNPDNGTLAIYKSKSGKPRHVVLTDEGQEFFQTLTAGRDAGEVLLRRADGGAWGTSHQARLMIEACRVAKIKPACGVHTLRHTWASLAVIAGVPLLVVARNLGHVDTKMIERHYGHLAQSYVTDAIRKGAPRFGNSSSSVVPLRRGA
jgi:integrase